MCGEKGGDRNDQTVKHGSPPHVRGEVTHSIKSLETIRITPACAGRSARKDKRKSRL